MMFKRGDHLSIGAAATVKELPKFSTRRTTTRAASARTVLLLDCCRMETAAKN